MLVPVLISGSEPQISSAPGVGDSWSSLKMSRPRAVIRKGNILNNLVSLLPLLYKE